MINKFIRVANAVFGPVLAVVFAGLAEGVTIGGRDAALPIGAGLAALVMLVIEFVLGYAPKNFAWSRRLLDHKAAFEGYWLQEFDDFPTGKRLSFFSVEYMPDSDSFTIEGTAYLHNQGRVAEWRSTQMFFSNQRGQLAYTWTGALITRDPNRSENRDGLSKLFLTGASTVRFPTTGHGEVDHLLENKRLQFQLRRVTAQYLRSLGLTLEVDELTDRTNRQAVVRAWFKSKLPKSESAQIDSPTSASDDFLLG